MKASKLQCVSDFYTSANIMLANILMAEACYMAEFGVKGK